MIIAGAALVALVACNKSETVVKESQSEITFKAVTNVMTKADPQLSGTSLGTDNNDVRMYVSATTNTANGAVENAAYMENQRFAYKAATQLWRPVAAADPTSDQHIYWPLDGSTVDFLAYAYYNEASSAATAAFTGQITPTWETNKADGMTFTDIDLYTNDLDLMYAAANAKKGGAVNGNYKPVDLVFHHAGAVLELNIKSNVKDVVINEVKFGNLVTEGKYFYDGTDATTLAASNRFTTMDKVGILAVDNTKNTLAVTWTQINQSDIDESSHTNNYHYGELTAFKGFSDETLDTADTYTDIDNVIIIPQPKLNFIIKYTDAAGKVFYVTAPVPKGNWLAGHKYVYNVNITFYEIEVHESVIDYTTEDAVAIPLS